MRSRRRVFYEGLVQGVGFRWTARRLASGLPIHGWVRNLLDGRVEMVVEGEEPDVEAYLAAVAQRFEGMVRHREIRPEPPEGLSGGFEITHP